MKRWLLSMALFCSAALVAADAIEVESVIVGKKIPQLRRLRGDIWLVWTGDSDAETKWSGGKVLAAVAAEDDTAPEKAKGGILELKIPVKTIGNCQVLAKIEKNPLMVSDDNGKTWREVSGRNAIIARARFCRVGEFIKVLVANCRKPVCKSRYVYMDTLTIASVNITNVMARRQEDGSLRVGWITDVPVEKCYLQVFFPNGVKKVFEEEFTGIRNHAVTIPAKFLREGEMIKVAPSLNVEGDFQKDLAVDYVVAPINHGVVTKDFQVKLTIADEFAPRKNSPVCSGVPFSRGVLAGINDVVLCDENNRQIPATFRVFSRWTDGSVKWLAVEFAADTLEKNTVYYLKHGKNFGVAPTDLKANVDGLTCEIVTADGKKFTLALAKLKPCEKRIIPNGDVTVYKGDFPDSVFAFRLEARRCGSEYTCCRWSVISERATESTLVKSIRVTGFPKISGAKDLTLRQFTTEKVNDRRDGFVVGDDRAIYFADFWQTAPKGLVVKDGETTFEILPELPAEFAKREYPGLEIFIHGYWYKDGCYLFRDGVEISGDFTIYSGKVHDKANLKSQLATPLFAACDPEYYCGTKAFGPLFAADGKTFPELDEMFESNFQVDQNLREHLNEYGWLNYGDWFGERTINWGDNEYDLPYTMMLQFARTGVMKYFRRGLEMARHYTTVDFDHHSAPTRQLELFHKHSVGHTGGNVPYSDEKYGKFKRFRFCFMLNTFDEAGGHQFSSGLLLTAALTGDRRMFDLATAAIAQNARYMTINVKMTIERAVGWAITNASAGYEFTGDPLFFNSARLFFEKAYSKQNPETGCFDLPQDRSECNCVDKLQHRGGKTFATGVLSHGLRRYYDASGDERAKTVILRSASWAKNHAFDPNAGKFRYKTGCPKYAVGSEIEPLILEGIAFAGLLSGDRSYSEFAAMMLSKLIAKNGANFPHKSFVKQHRTLAHTLYFVNKAGITKLPKNVNQNKLTKHRVLPNQKNGAVIIPAESFISESGGSVQMRYDKRTIRGKSFSHWDKIGHKLAWQVKPARGAYKLGICYAAIAGTPRVLRINNKTIGEVNLPPSGGLGDYEDGWMSDFIKIDGKAVTFTCDGESPVTIELENNTGMPLNVNFMWYEPIK